MKDMEKECHFDISSELVSKHNLITIFSSYQHGIFVFTNLYYIFVFCFFAQNKIVPIRKVKWQTLIFCKKLELEFQNNSKYIILRLNTFLQKDNQCKRRAKANSKEGTPLPQSEPKPILVINKHKNKRERK